MLKINIISLAAHTIQFPEGDVVVTYKMLNTSDHEDRLQALRGAKAEAQFLNEVVQGVEGVEIEYDGEPIDQANQIQALISSPEHMARLMGGYIECWQKKVLTGISNNRPANGQA